MGKKSNAKKHNRFKPVKRQPVQQQKSYEPSTYSDGFADLERYYMMAAGRLYGTGQKEEVKEKEIDTPEILLKEARKHLYEDKGWERLTVEDNERRAYTDKRQYSVYQRYEQQAFGMQLPSDKIDCLYRFLEDGSVEVVEAVDPNLAILYELEKLMAREGKGYD
jgi:hypothetical protein